MSTISEFQIYKNVIELFKEGLNMILATKTHDEALEIADETLRQAGYKPKDEEDAK